VYKAGCCACSKAAAGVTFSCRALMAGGTNGRSAAERNVAGMPVCKTSSVLHMFGSTIGKGWHGWKVLWPCAWLPCVNALVVNAWDGGVCWMC